MRTTKHHKIRSNQSSPNSKHRNSKHTSDSAFESSLHFTKREQLPECNLKIIRTTHKCYLRCYDAREKTTTATSTHRQSYILYSIGREVRKVFLSFSKELNYNPVYLSISGKLPGVSCILPRGQRPGNCELNSRRIFWFANYLKLGQCSQIMGCIERFVDENGQY